MKYTSDALSRLSSIGGSRCCKRHAYLSFLEAINYINNNYSVILESNDIKCHFYNKNEQCSGIRCPFRGVK